MKHTSPQVDAFLATVEQAWQREKLEAFRELVHHVEPTISEDLKWGVPVFLFNGKLVCAMSSFKENTKYNFFEGAYLDDPDSIFNSGLDSKKHRSIYLREDEPVPTKALSEIIRQAVDRTLH